MSTRILWVAVLSGLGLPLFARVLAQAPETPRPTFAVALVKESARDSQTTNVQFLSSGRFVARGTPLTVVIAIAYGLPLQSDRLIGSPGWTENARYDFEAVAEPDAIPLGTSVNARNQKIRLMLQGLLADRFKLRVHREIKDGPVYEITTKNGGPNLAKSTLTEQDCDNSLTSPAPGDPAACHTFAGGAIQGVQARAASMSDLVSWMSNWADHPVIDKTGLQGLFDIETEGWAPLRSKAPPPGQDRASGEAERPTLFQIFDRLGLKLDLKRGPTETWVIDHIERPTED